MKHLFLFACLATLLSCGREPAADILPPDDTLPLDSGTFTLYLEYTDTTPADTLALRFWDLSIAPSLIDPGPAKELLVLEEGQLLSGSPGKMVGYRSFPMVSAYGFLSISRPAGYYYFLNEFLVRKNDTLRVHIDAARASVTFADPAYHIQQALAAETERWRFSHGPVLLGASEDEADDLLPTRASRAQTALSGKSLRSVPDGQATWDYVVGRLGESHRDFLPYTYLEGQREELDTAYFGILAARTAGAFYHQRVMDFLVMRGADRETRARGYRELVSRLPTDLAPAWAVPYAPEYRDYLVALYTARQNFEDRPVLESVYSEHVGVAADQLAGQFTLYNFRYLKAGPALMADALERVKTPWIRDALARASLSLGEGKPVTDAVFTGLDGNPVSLSDLKGKHVFMDFWFTGCPGCLKYYGETLSDVEEHFAGDGRLVFASISSDKDPERWRRSVADGKYSSHSSLHLLAGPEADTFYRAYQISAYPRQLLLDPEGKVLRASGLNLPAPELINLLDHYLNRQ